MKWMWYLQDPLSIIISPSWIYHDNANIVAEVLTQQKHLYSSDFFDTVEDVFKLSTTSNCLVNTIENFFDLIKN
jgi:hypothetical protein